MDLKDITFEDYDDIFEIIKNYNSKITDSSIKAYTLNIVKILKDLDSTADILLDYDKIYKFFDDSDNYKTTIRNKVNAIINFLRGSEQDKNIIEKYSIFSDSLSIKISRNNFKMEKNEKEFDNWVSLDELKERIEELKLKVPKIFKTYHDIALYQRYIAGLIQVETGLRNEIADCKIMNYDEYKKIDIDIDSNYLIIKNRCKEAKLIIQNYKTKKTYGIVEIDFDEFDTKEIKNYFKEITKFKEYNNIKNNWLIFDKFGDKLNRNEYTKFLNTVFNIEDKKISSTMIRKIILSSTYDAEMMKNKALKMGHSVSTQIKHYIKS
jgi:hypothetical protein